MAEIPAVLKIFEFLFYWLHFQITDPHLSVTIENYGSGVIPHLSDVNPTIIQAPCVNQSPHDFYPARR